MCYQQLKEAIEVLAPQAINIHKELKLYGNGTTILRLRAGF